MINVILIDVEKEEVNEIEFDLSDLDKLLKSKLIDYIPYDNDHYLFFSDDKKFKKCFQINELKFTGNGLLIGYDVINNRLSDVIVDIDNLNVDFSTKNNFFTKIFY